MKIGILIARIFLSIILVLSIVCLVTLYSINKNFNEENFNEVVSDVGSEMLLEEAIERGETNEAEISELYNVFLAQCAFQDDIFLEDANITLSCEEIESAGEENIGELLKSKLQEKISEGIEAELEKQEISDKLVVLKWIVMGVFIFTIMMIIVLFFVSNPRHTFLTNLGVVFAVSGIPFLPLRALPLQEMLERESLNRLAEAIIRDIQTNFMIIFIVGIILFVSGLIVSFVMKKKAKKEAKKNESS